MQNPKTCARLRLAGKPLIGFSTQKPRMPGAMVGNIAEIKPAP